MRPRNETFQQPPVGQGEVDEPERAAMPAGEVRPLTEGLERPAGQVDAFGIAELRQDAEHVARSAQIDGLRAPDLARGNEAGRDPTLEPALSRAQPVVDISDVVPEGRIER